MSRFSTVSGRLISVEDFRPEDISLDDIAHHLAKIQRFGGAMPIDKTYSVGEHCINLVLHCKKVAGFSTLGLRMMLLHDASEAYLSDVVSPAKKHLPDYIKLENKIQKTINEKFLKISVSIDDNNRLKELDKRIIIDEVAAIKPDLLGLYKKETGLKGIGCCIHYNSPPATVKAYFLTLAKELSIHE